MDDALNRLTDQGLAAEYADLRAGLARNGILDRHRLRRIELGLGSKYVFLPGLAQFDEEIPDKVQGYGLKIAQEQGDHAADLAPALGHAIRSHCVGVIRRRYCGDGAQNYPRE